MSTMTLSSAYMESVIKRFNSCKELGEKTFVQLSEIDFQYTPNEASNSIAYIIQHLHGNMLSRWTNFLTEDGEKSWRDRDEEFENQNYSRARLLELWNEGWDCMFKALKNLNEDDLIKTVYIRKQPLTAVDAINWQLAHYSYHIGQIVFMAKILRNQDWKSLTVPKRPSIKQ
jgi:Protein of unknown function (DUF1572)